MFDIDYLSLFSSLPSWLSTAIISTIPIAELRVSLPLALTIYHLNVGQALFFSITGNLIPVFFILLFIQPVTDFLRKKSKILDKFFVWLFQRTRHKFEKKYSRWGELALISFVAIPLPFTGSWTGALAAFLFGIPLKRAFLLIAAGVIGAALIVTLLTLGVVKIF